MVTAPPDPETRRLFGDGAPAGCGCPSCRAAERAEVWQARALAAEKRVADLETLIRDAVDLLGRDKPRAARKMLDAAHA